MLKCTGHLEQLIVRFKAFDDDHNETKIQCDYIRTDNLCTFCSVFEFKFACTGLGLQITPAFYYVLINMSF